MISTQIVGFGGLVAISVTILVFLCDRWLTTRRVGKIRNWVNHYVRVHYGRVGELSVKCAENQQMPIFARFEDDFTGTTHLLEFAYSGGPVVCSFVSEHRELTGLNGLESLEATAFQKQSRPARFDRRSYCRENAGRSF
jgi:hypothetical protein